MDAKDEQTLTDYWHRQTCRLNEIVDDTFKQAQDHAYALGLKRGAPPSPPHDLARAQAVAAATEVAIRDYHFALDSREHGGVAQDKAIKAIEAALNLPWRQGEELARRKE